jgi:hypothetical protein
MSATKERTALYDFLSEIVTYGPHRSSLDAAFPEVVEAKAAAAAKAADDEANPVPVVSDEEAFAAAVKAEVAKALKAEHAPKATASKGATK